MIAKIMNKKECFTEFDDSRYLVQISNRFHKLGPSDKNTALEEVHSGF